MADNLADLTDLIAAHVLSGPYIEYDSDGHHADDFYRCGENCKWTSNEGTVNRSAFAAHAAHVALVVEQHTNGRIAELEARIANAQSLCNATGRYNAARQKHWNIRVFACDVLAALKGRAALEGEQQ